VTPEHLVRVHDLTPRHDVARRLSVVSQLCPAAHALPDGFAPFLPDAVAPAGEWRAPTPAELAALVGAAPGESDVLVVAVPGIARTLSPHLRGDLAAVRQAARDLALVTALDDCLDELIPFCQRPDDLACQGAWVNPGGMRMVTHNLNLDPAGRIGFHVDNWDDLPLAERARGRKRLCVNLGAGPRYLLFLRTPVSLLVAARVLPPRVPGEGSPASLVRAHLGQHLRQLAVRVRVDPGEAYVMNADDVIHDGASGAPGVADAALHFLGHFGAPDAALALSSPLPARGERVG
jgi:hypothetical protein